MDRELEPCPGCRSTNVTSGDESEYSGYVHCFDCGWNLQQKSEDEARHLWNTRQPSPLTGSDETVREAFEARRIPHLDLKRNEDGSYHYEAACMAFRDFSDGWNAAIQRAKSQINGGGHV